MCFSSSECNTLLYMRATSLKLVLCLHWGTQIEKTVCLINRPLLLLYIQGMHFVFVFFNSNTLQIHFSWVAILCWDRKNWLVHIHTEWHHIWMQLRSKQKNRWRHSSYCPYLLNQHFLFLSKWRSTVEKWTAVWENSIQSLHNLSEEGLRNELLYYQ